MQPRVNSPEPGACWKPVARWAAGASALLYVISRFVTDSPKSRHSPLDDSWMQALHTAFVEHWQFGRDIVFTFGPWGFLYGGYHPATHVLSMVIWAALSAVFWWAGWRVARSFSSNAFVSWLWLIAFTALAGSALFLNVDVRVGGLLLLLWALHFFVEERPLSAVRSALVVSLGLLSLAKFSSLVMTLIFVGIIALDTVVRQRRFPWIAPLFIAGVLGFWMAARQDLNGLKAFWVHSSWVTSGYTEAMTLPGAKETQDVSIFLVVAGLVGVLAGYAVWARGRGDDKEGGEGFDKGDGKNRWLGILPLGGLGLMGLMAFKYGYVRHDGHEVTGTIELVQLAMVCGTIAWPIVRKKWPAPVAGVMAASPMVLALLFAASTFGRYSEQGLAVVVGKTLSLRELAGPARLLAGRGREDFERYCKAVQQSFPLPQMEGETDIYPWNQAALLARGFPYRPRPVFASYIAYTPELAELNAAFLRSDRAPRNIVWTDATVDNAFPSLADGLSWPELLTRYDLQEVQLPFLVWRKAAPARNWRLVPLAEISVPLGQPMAVPGETNTPVWVRFDLERNLAGSIVSTFYKPPVFWLNVTTRDGSESRWRLVPGMARGGFLLSPLVEDCLSFASVVAADGGIDLSGKEVVSLAISADTESGSTTLYERAVRLHFYRLDFPRQNLSRAKGFRELKSLFRALKGNKVLRADYSPKLEYCENRGTVLVASPDSAVQFTVPAQSKKLNVGFGVFGERANLPAVKAVVFKVSTLGTEGSLAPLWSQRIELGASATAVREPQRVAIDLSQCQATNLVLETLSEGHKPGNERVSYWSEIGFE